MLHVASRPLGPAFSALTVTPAVLAAAPVATGSQVGVPGQAHKSPLAPGMRAGHAHGYRAAIAARQASQRFVYSPFKEFRK